jgi:hypothetical protein
MRQTALVAGMIAFCLVTAVAMFAAVIVMQPPPMAASTGADARPVVYAFYDAVNEVLRTGDSAALDGVLAPRFVMHGTWTTVSPDRDGLMRHVVATSTVNPTLQLDVEELAVVADRAVVHLAQAGDGPGAFLGTAIATPSVFWGQVDALRVEGGRIAELWGGVGQTPVLESLGQSQLERLVTPNQAMTFRRLSAEAGSDWTWAATFQSRVLYVDAGAIEVEVAPSSLAPAVIFAAGVDRGQGRPVLPGTRDHLWAGEALVLSPSVLCLLRSDGSQPALRAYEVAFPGHWQSEPFAPGVVQPPVQPPALPARELLAEVTDPGLPHDALRLAFGRIVLPPGNPLVLAEAAGLVLLTVEAGSLGIDGNPGESVAAWRRLAPGKSAVVRSGNAAMLQAVGAEPVVIFAVTIRAA